MNIDYIVQIWKEDKRFIAHAMPLDVASSGDTPDEARHSVDEAVFAFLEAAKIHGTFDDVLYECGYRNVSDTWICPEYLPVEKHDVEMST